MELISGPSSSSDPPMRLNDDFDIKEPAKTELDFDDFDTVTENLGLQLVLIKNEMKTHFTIGVLITKNPRTFNLKQYFYQMIKFEMRYDPKTREKLEDCPVYKELGLTYGQISSKPKQRWEYSDEDDRIPVPLLKFIS